ncbi:GmrSD restriction endonuclease domain-containing protein [Arthrobacter bambusae]|uniref:Excalibur calcium-binding domain-containing protein n=1 Tax=Arthrobacter bambusae TaxID=1338426 RepID=A0AAW8DIH0_9MICC|nr:DUF1524 domain-containing protein [Arthrobacter bambusae]MDP9905642.1 hypothetical protein [Arthrobacter bambusae]MDQ0127276.1 hypothetical protein [Arthrobacter bambusae]MDQ0178618.1 hypothetical protein [Arthrobacter bambusae]
MFDRKSSGGNVIRKLPVSTYIVGGIALLVVVVGGSARGVGGMLLMFGIVALLTGLYVALTGRRSWAVVRGGRKAGAVVLAASLCLFVAGGAVLPRTQTESIDASAVSTNGDPAAGAAKNSPSSPAPTPGPNLPVEPLDPDNVTEFAQSVSITAPRPELAYATKALDLLSTIPVKGRAPKTGYDRALFGQAWVDVDRNGCDTRNDILKRDLTNLAFTNSVPCKVQSGKLADPYTGKSLDFLRGSTTSTAVQIDHVVALSDAWQKGAQLLTLEQRTAFANDPLNLQATDGPTNVQKGDGDAATWLPPNKTFRCEYVARQISVKATYNLWVTQAEHDAMAGILAGCSGQLAPTNEKAALAPMPSQAASVQVAHAPESSPIASAVRAVPATPDPVASAPASVYYENCTAAKAAGAAPLYAGQPGYRTALDRDGDGVACEK